MCKVSDRPANVIRIATYNIASGRYTERGLEPMNALLADQNIDVAGLQELDRFNRRNNYDMLGEFLKFGYFSQCRYQKTIDFMGGEYGIGVLSRLPVLESSGGPLPNNRQEGRAYVRILVEKDGRKIAVYNTHLAYESRALRTQQMEYVLQVMDADPTPYKILTGDFNVELSREEVYPMLKRYNLANGWENVWFDTFNRPGPDMKISSIDNIVFSTNIRLKKADMICSSLSDHNPFWAELELLDQSLVSRQFLEILITEGKKVRPGSCRGKNHAALAQLLQEAQQLSADASEQKLSCMCSRLQACLECINGK